jgi:F420-dependent oxidoreductase-like protein
VNKVRVGIHCGQQNSDYLTYKDLWLSAQAYGLDWASVFDHFMPIQADPTGNCFEGYTLLSAMAAITEKIAIGIIVTGVTYRHPCVVANMAATIDHISNGRLELGMGAAWYELEHQQYGIKFPNFKTRAQMLDEALTVIKGLFKQEEFSFSGRFYTLNRARMQPKPLGELPMWIGGLGEKYTLRLVAKHADGWNALLMDLSEYKRKCDILKSYLAEFGRDFEQIRKAVVFQAIVGETEKEVNELLVQRASELKVDPQVLKASAFIGTVDQLLDKLLPLYQLGVRDFLMLMRPPKNDYLLKVLANYVAPALKNLKG